MSRGISTHVYNSPNKAKRDAAEYLAQARALKARVLAGESFYEWERPAERIASLVSSARLYAGLSRMYRSLNRPRT